MASQLAALAHARDAARDVGAGIARGRADLEAVLRAEIQVQTWLTAQQKSRHRPACIVLAYLSRALMNGFLYDIV